MVWGEVPWQRRQGIESLAMRCANEKTTDPWDPPPKYLCLIKVENGAGAPQPRTICRVVTKVSKIDLASAQVNCNEAVNSRLNRPEGKDPSRGLTWKWYPP